MVWTLPNEVTQEIKVVELKENWHNGFWAPVHMDDLHSSQVRAWKSKWARHIRNKRKYRK